jgi:hypothetical protein
LGNKRIKLSSPTVTKLHQLLKKRFIQQSLVTTSGKQNKENHCAEMNMENGELQTS